jgi:hypothetical protein
MKHALSDPQRMDAADYCQAALVDTRAIAEICGGNVEVVLAAHKAIAALLELEQAIDVQPVVER